MSIGFLGLGLDAGLPAVSLEKEEEGHGYGPDQAKHHGSQE